ncbi:MAG: molecular chaperone TorD family protein [Candidatus Omnitrophota bacterium]
MQREECIDLVLPDIERLLRYKTLAVAFAYPDENFFTFFPHLSSEKVKLLEEYDTLFRASQIWLYGAEHLVKNEFQRVENLSDIMAFYRAFGLEPNKDRPDSLSCEMEFMYYLIFKKIQAQKLQDSHERQEKIGVVLDGQKKFFFTHLYPAAQKIAEALISQGNNFYSTIAKEMLEFLKSEEKFLSQLQENCLRR